MENVFADLIPENSKHTGTFDDLIPSKKKKAPAYGPNQPVKKSASPQRKRARQNARELGQQISDNLPGKQFREYLPKSGPGAYLTAPINAATHLVDEGLKQYGNAYWGGLRGVPLAGAYVDEAVAYVGSKLGEDYNTALEHVRALDDVSEKDYPVANAVGKIIGGVGGGYGIGANVIAKGAPLAVNALRSGVAGAAVSGAHDFGNAEGGYDKRVKKAKDGALIGGAISTAIPALSAVATPIKVVASKLTPQRFKKTFADDEILLALQSDGITPKEAFNKFARTQKNRRLHSNSVAESPVAIVDLGENLTGLGRTVTTNPGPARKLGSEFIENRQFSQNDRINDALERGLRQKSSDGFFKTKDELIKKQRSMSEPAYKKAYSNAQEVDLTDAIKVWKTRADETSVSIGKQIKKAIKDIERVYRVKSPERALKVLNGAKQGLDDAIMKNRLKAPNLTRELTLMKRELLERVDDANPDYKSARAIYSGNAELIDAQNVGRSFAKGDTEMSVKAFSALSKPEKEMFRKGVIQDLKEKMGDKQFTHNRTSLFNTPNAREVLKAVFQKDTAKFKPYKQFIDLVDTEARFVTTRNKIMGGSPTATRLAENQEFSVRSAGSFMEKMKDGRLSDAVIGGITKKLDEMLGVRKQDAEEIAKLLFNDNPKYISKTLLRLHRKYGKQKTENMLDIVGQEFGKFGVSGQVFTRE